MSRVSGVNTYAKDKDFPIISCMEFSRLSGKWIKRSNFLLNFFMYISSNKQFHNDVKFPLNVSIKRIHNNFLMDI